MKLSKRLKILLKPDFIKVIITLLLLVYPFIQERAVNAQGAVLYADEYSVMNLIVAYTRLRQFTPLLMLTGLTLFIYVLVAIFTCLATKIYRKKFKKKS